MVSAMTNHPRDEHVQHAGCSILGLYDPGRAYAVRAAPPLAQTRPIAPKGASVNAGGEGRAAGGGSPSAATHHTPKSAAMYRDTDCSACRARCIAHPASINPPQGILECCGGGRGAQGEFKGVWGWRGFLVVYMF